ncbi:Kinesin-like protein [Phytophthora palmivora]|uniref:Kinesin-like protein n=1 Tax=Phytophthora palmivora TaxID=4796 RepID=A0A2P4YF38_9STRA|nr:Kinesin-like protein [Phytophthora palmivora]
MDASETPTSGPSGGKDKETVKVVVRCRPLFGKELVEGRKSIITLDQAAALISLKCPDNGQIKSFTFDSVYDENTSQRQFYDESGYPLVESIFDGYNGTIFAYGQTGCGKTHTMQGKDSPPELRGVIPLSFDHIFDTINADTKREYMVRASYLEIYNEDIRDLLNEDTKKKLDLKESAEGTVYVKDLTEIVVRDVESMNNVMSRGFKNRTVGATLMNEGSSRSHSIFTVVVETSETIGGQDHFKAGKLNLVDLAGSERQSKTGATGNRLKEGCKINLSLSALGNVISALVDGKGKHIPYRDSKLTRLLQDSLGGNTKTLMVAAVSPADYNYDETLSTLRYANRAKNIKNKPIVNEDPKDAKLREYKEEIERLRKMLESQSQSRGNGLDTSSGIATPSRPFSTSSGSRTNSSPDLTKDREEIAKYQQEATEMLERAKRMMDEAQALQAQHQTQQTDSTNISKVVVKEVIPDSHVKEHNELRELNQSILNQRDRIGQELEQTQVAMEAYMREKEMLHAKLKKIESHILGGASGSSSTRGSITGNDGDSEVALLRQQVEYRRAQIKLREKAKKQAKNEAMRRALELEKQQVEEELKTAQEAAQASLTAARKKEAKYKAKLEATRQEIADLNSEFERERENMLDTIREQTKEAKLLEQLVELFLPQNELVKVWERAVWSEEREEWNLPKLRPRSDFHTIKLPTLGSGGSSGIESGGAEVVSDHEENGRQGSAGRTTVRSLGSSSSVKRKKNSISRQPPQNVHGVAITPYDNDGLTIANTTATSARIPSAIHTSRPDTKVAGLAARGMSPHNSSKTSNLVTRGMSPHNSSNGTKERRKHKDKDKDKSSGSSVSRQPQEDHEPQLASAYEAPGASHFFPADEDLLAPLSGEYQPRDRLQSRQGSRQDSRQEKNKQSGSVSGTSRGGLGQLEHTPPVETASEKTRSSSRGDSESRQGNPRHHRHRDRKERQHEDDAGAGKDEWIETENGVLAPVTKKKSSKPSRKKKERRDKGQPPVENEIGDSVNDHQYLSLRRTSFRSLDDLV